MRKNKNKLLGPCIIFFYLTIFLSVVSAETATVSWDANTESDLSGYKIHYGTESAKYNNVIDVGNVTSFQINNLQPGNTYYFAVTAYDFSGNQSDYSQEVSAFINSSTTDTNAPELVAVVPRGETQIDVVFSEPVDKTSAENSANYSVSNGIQVLGAILATNETTVHLITSKHDKNTNYTLEVSNIKDKAGNVIASGSSKDFSLPDPTQDSTPPELVYVVVVDETHLEVIFNEALDKNLAENKNNYSINNNIQVTNAILKDNQTIVQLTTSTHVSGQYTLTVSSVQDLAGNNIQNNNSFSYQYQSTDNNSDTTPPYMTSVSIKGETQIDVNFAESVSKSTSENINNYAINNGISILGAILDVNLTTVHLITSSHQSNVEYTLTVNNVEDLSGNKISSNSNIKYTLNSGSTNTTDDITPSTFSLFQNYPNPFNPETEIRFYLSQSRKIELNVYNSLGQLVKTLVKDEMPGGYHTLVWNGTNLDGIQVPSGVYIYSLEVSRKIQNGDLLVNVSLERRVKRMTLIR